METLLETWRINARLNHFLLDAIPPEQMAVKLAKGKSVAGNFAHVHNVRLMWLKSAAPDLWEGMSKLDPDQLQAESPGDPSPPSPLSPGGARGSLTSSLLASDEAIAELLRRAGSPEGKIKGFKPHAQAFLGYLISHETFHRTCIELALRQNGTPLSDKVAYGLWEWGVR